MDNNSLLAFHFSPSNARLGVWLGLDVFQVVGSTENLKYFPLSYTYAGIEVLA